MMKRLLIAPIALLALATSARSETPATPQSDVPVMKKSAPGQAHTFRIVTVKAKVVAVDQEKRIITLERKGKTEKFVVGPEVKRLNEIAAGDTITVKYRQGLLLQAAPAGSKALKPTATGEVERAGAEQAPGGTAQVEMMGTVTVTAVDPKTRTVVLETPRGELVKLKADPSIDLKKVKAGQKYDGVYSESVAISVEKAKQKM